MAKAVLITGSNLGDTKAYMTAAQQAIEHHVGRIVAASGLRESEPWGFEAPQRFLNQVLVVETALSPEELLTATAAIESHLGRTHKGEFSPDGQRCYHSRTMDIDILFYDNTVYRSPRLTIPHPLLQDRAFVLGPLCEVMPEYVHPVLHQTIRDLDRALSKKNENA